MDVAAWLRGIGFERYEAAFRDNGIDEAVLPHLTAEDLKEIGVATVGDRRKLLAAIAALAPPILSGEAGELHTERNGGRASRAPRRREAAAPLAGKEGGRRGLILPSAVPSLSCSAIPSGPPPLRRDSIPRTGAVWSAPISTKPRRR